MSKRDWTACSNVVEFLGSIVSIMGGVVLGCFMVPTFLTLKNHSRNRGAQKTDYCQNLIS